ncbi:MAG: type II toxin-antitoxin system VapC family toxin [Thiocapsa sp.]|uniref:type II toxin-antitoxin system VapC family toxin n=1 Tax=Thiocapsa sp. TaxID=2024551 RepID=UPI001BCB4E63|nr:type II toxin-antitoxin system VapC family toxin [Thiocapsa sp.]QVL48947.1 MAG: type II toxin-antitoxin system VapC family toxin [Thiocapsa sp.]
MTLVIDASVVVKWLFDDPENERYTALATELMAGVVAGDIEVVQPPHWIIEVGAVLARQTPERAQRDLALLDALGLPTRSSPSTLARACALAIDLDHHLFDTLYHATALEYEGCLITADDRYHRKARALPGIIHLCNWNAGHGKIESHRDRS